jgi:GxxExxY protein
MSNQTGFTGLTGFEQRGVDDPLSEQAIGCAMKVHRILGPGFLESVYRNAFILELRKSGIQVEPEVRTQVRYEGVVVGDFLCDLLIGGRLICELKAIQTLTKADEVQTVNYLTATGRDIGLLINFGAQSLQFKRKFRKSKSDDAPHLWTSNPVNPVNPV